MEKIIVIEGLGADYVSPSLPLHIIDTNNHVVLLIGSKEVFSVLQKTNRLL